MRKLAHWTVAALLVCWMAIPARAGEGGWRTSQDISADWDARVSGELRLGYRRLLQAIENSIAGRRAARSEEVQIALVDLNGDGIDEALVHVPAHRSCGNWGWCSAGLYRRDGDRWTLIGVPTVPDFAGMTMIFVEEEARAGWRTFNTGRHRYCWTDLRNTPRKAAEHPDRLDADPHAVTRRGWFAYTRVRIAERCPEANANSAKP